MFNKSWWDMILPEFCGAGMTASYIEMCSDGFNVQRNLVMLAAKDAGGTRRDQFSYYEPVEDDEHLRRMPIEWQAT